MIEKLYLRLLAAMIGKRCVAANVTVHGTLDLRDGRGIAICRGVTVFTA
jgi:hypothetical protein